MRVPLIAGNWKMHKRIGEAVHTANQLKALTEDVQGVEMVVCPVFTALQAVSKALAGSQIAVGGQNCYLKESGAFTGEVSPQMLLDAGCKWTIIGHSERRQYFHETDELLNQKLRFALSSGLKVMFCIGETLDERQGGKMNEVLTRQVVKGLDGLTEQQCASLAIAYEPVWAIGTGVTATPEQAEEAHGYVRTLVEKQLGATVARSMRIQYGGSVKPDNAAELLKKPDVDGALVGGASLQADSFAAIIRAAL